jgi:hypothetical protein
MVTLNYLLYLPKEYGEDKSKRWPLILFLHGAGERGSDLNKVKALGPPKLVAEGKEMPFIIVSPQVPERSTWDPEALDALLGEIIGQYAVDEDGSISPASAWAVLGHGGWPRRIRSVLQPSRPSVAGVIPAWPGGSGTFRPGCSTEPGMTLFPFRPVRRWWMP